MKKMKLKDFEFSQNYTLFWDKLERANYFLEAIIETADRPVDDRTVAFLLDRPLDDGGQWNMFVNIVRKHGLVPKAAMPETAELVRHRADERGAASHQLREGAKLLRELRSSGAPMEAARAAKQRDPRDHLPHPLHPPGHAAGASSTGSGTTKTRSSTATAT